MKDLKTLKKENYILAKKDDKQGCLQWREKLKKKLKGIESDMQAFYCITKQIKQENKGPINKKKYQRWYWNNSFQWRKKNRKQYHKSLLDIEYPWWEEDLSIAGLVLGHPSLISKDIVKQFICKIKNLKNRSTLRCGEWNYESFFQYLWWIEFRPC